MKLLRERVIYVIYSWLSFIFPFHATLKDALAGWQDEMDRLVITDASDRLLLFVVELDFILIFAPL